MRVIDVLLVDDVLQGSYTWMLVDDVVDLFIHI